MEEFQHVFLRLCKDHHVEPEDSVLSALKSAAVNQSKPFLSLSTNSLSPKTCAILGKVIAADRYLTELHLADCMLSEDAVKGIAYGLMSNVALRKLDLKGNNIRAGATEVLGKMLKHNHTLTSLCLEWNALGMLDSSFALFCEGIGSNNCLRMLDLRNNQISHDGAAELGSHIKRNTTLSILDLRWNNIGLLGGRALLDMMQSNKSVTKLDLAGNNIPDDVNKAIGTAVSHNADRQALTTDYSKRTHILSSHIKQLEQDSSLQMNDLMDAIDKQEDQLRKSKRSSAFKIGQLQETLEERKSAFNTLASKLTLTESELSLTEQKVNDYNQIIAKFKQELADVKSAHQNELRREKEDRAVSESRLLKELAEASDRNVHMEGKLSEFELKHKGQQEQLYAVKEQLTQLQADLRVNSAHHEERVQQLKQQHKDTMHEAEQLKQRELTRVRQEHDDTEKLLKERIQKAEFHRLDVEEQLCQLKSSSASDRLQADETLVFTRQKIRAEEELRVKQLEDKLRVMSVGKDELQVQSNQQASIISDMQAANGRLSLEVDSMKRRIADLQQELSGKSTEVATEVNKVRLELGQQLARVESERCAQVEVRDRLEKAERDLADHVRKHREALEDKERELVMVQERLKSRELDIIRNREEEQQRANLLQSAIMNYCSRPTLTTSVTNQGDFHL